MKPTPIAPDHTLNYALDILARGPKAAVSPYLTDKQAAEYTKAAQAAVDGDADDLHWLEAQDELAERADEAGYAYEVRTGREFDPIAWMEAQS